MNAMTAFPRANLESLKNAHEKFSGNVMMLDRAPRYMAKAVGDAIDKTNGQTKPMCPHSGVRTLTPWGNCGPRWSAPHRLAPAPRLARCAAMSNGG